MKVKVFISYIYKYDIILVLVHDMIFKNILAYVDVNYKKFSYAYLFYMIYIYIYMAQTVLMKMVTINLNR